MKSLKIGKYYCDQHRKELDFVIEKVRGKKNLIEIGLHKGGTFYALAKEIRGKHISIDMHNYVDVPEEEIETIENNLKKDIKNCTFIHGDSHLDNIENQVKAALNGQLVDVLFIDGDHSYKGVRADYRRYKKYVAEGGLIIFHDIIESEFHCENGCFVFKLWSELAGEKEECITSNEWGGIGVLVNKKVKWEINQIYFDEESEKYLLPEFKAVKNIINNTIYYENDIIIDIAKDIKNIQCKTCHTGVVSWKWKMKTDFKITDFIEKIEATNNQYDVILFPPFRHKDEDCIERNKKHYTNLFRLCELFDKLNILEFKTCSDEWTVSYCNFWIARLDVLQLYYDKVLKLVYDAFENNKEIRNFCETHFFFHNNKWIHIAPFFMELLMGFFVNHYNISHISIYPDYFDDVITSNERIKKIPNIICEVIKKGTFNYGKKITFNGEMAYTLMRNGFVKINKEDNKHLFN